MFDGENECIGILIELFVSQTLSTNRDKAFDLLQILKQSQQVSDEMGPDDENFGF